jgi:transcriptional regulator with XRE-family HTH domain
MGDSMEFDRAGFDREVGLRLQRARKDRGITQEELAKRLGLPRPSYANIESGRQRIPLDVVWRAAIVLVVPINTLVPEPLPGRGDPVPRFSLVASVIPGSPAVANPSNFATSAPATEALGLATWRGGADGK